MGITITIVTRDINGKRSIVEFENEAAVLRWVDEEGIGEDDEILIVSQGNLCLYSALGKVDPLCIDDLTGFFG